MGDSLGDFLTKKSKDEIFNSHLIQNNILHAHIDFIKDPHRKFFVVLNCCPQNYNIGILFINSLANINVIRTPELQKLQYKILKKDYDFLDYDSLVDCSKIIEFKHTNMLEKYIKESHNFYMGILNNFDSMSILSLIEKSNIHPNKIKIKYGIAID